MDFKNASLEELKQFVKEHKIKGVSALRKPALIEFLEKITVMKQTMRKKIRT